MYSREKVSRSSAGVSNHALERILGQLPKGEAFQPSLKRTLIDGVWWDLGAGIVGTAAKTEEIDKHVLTVPECHCFEQRLFLGWMKGKRHTQEIYQLKIIKTLCLFRFDLQAVSLAVTCERLKYGRTITLPALMKLPIRKSLIVG